ncbi:hypothetical protein BV898_02750 [Hypsibius exemplaris]|uniref:Uncharacterized protein n=1 Tax=Hypsibius exemplaris TaxID=2072580 RepID=A0A1W0X7R8_HYPEX|nr:hypothetical protein BV898_02750 [Hypsibius exemplaris]
MGLPFLLYIFVFVFTFCDVTWANPRARLSPLVVPRVQSSVKAAPPLPQRPVVSIGARQTGLTDNINDLTDLSQEFRQMAFWRKMLEDEERHPSLEIPDEVAGHHDDLMMQRSQRAEVRKLDFRTQGWRR